MVNLLSLCGESANLREDIQELTSSALPAVIFGGGKTAIRVAEFLDRLCVPFSAFCETASYYHPGRTILNRPVYEYENLFKIYDKYNLILAARGEGTWDVWNQRAPGVHKRYILQTWPIMGKKLMGPEYVREHIDIFNEVYHLLADEASRVIFLSYLENRAHCVTIPVPRLPDLCTPDEYFNDLYDPSSSQCPTLVDCGAYIGDSAEQFLNFIAARNQKGRVLAFEPDPENFAQLQVTAEKMRLAGGGGD